MSMKPKIKKELEKLVKLINKRNRLEIEKEQLKSDIFKYETAYLETTQGTPLTKTSEYYVNNRIEKKKYNLSDKERIFLREFPKNFDN